MKAFIRRYSLFLVIYAHLTIQCHAYISWSQIKEFFGYEDSVNDLELDNGDFWDGPTHNP